MCRPVGYWAFIVLYIFYREHPFTVFAVFSLFRFCQIPNNTTEKTYFQEGNTSGNGYYTQRREWERKRRIKIYSKFERTAKSGSISKNQRLCWVKSISRNRYRTLGRRPRIHRNEHKRITTFNPLISCRLYRDINSRTSIGFRSALANNGIRKASQRRQPCESNVSMQLTNMPIQMGRWLNACAVCAASWRRPPIRYPWHLSGQLHCTMPSTILLFFPSFFLVFVSFLPEVKARQFHAKYR